MVDQSTFSEARIQQLAITEIRNKYPETYGCLYHVPNGGNRDPRTASILTGQGVVPGIQDLHFIWKSQLYLIEVKKTKGLVDPAQKVIHAQHKLHGYDTYIFRTSEQIIFFIEYIMAGKNLDGFKRFISPYSVAENLELYRQEFRVYKQRKMAKSS